MAACVRRRATGHGPQRSKDRPTNPPRYREEIPEEISDPRGGDSVGKRAAPAALPLEDARRRCGRTLRSASAGGP